MYANIVRRNVFKNFGIFRHISTIKQNVDNIVRSEIPDIEIPNATLPEFLYQNFSRWPDKVAIECGQSGRKYTFEEIRRKSKNLSRSLRKKFKLTKGDAISILLPNIPEYSICILGPLEAGLVVTTLNPTYTIEEISRHIVLTEAKAIFTLTSLVATAQLRLLHIPIIAIKHNETDALPQGVINFSELIENHIGTDDFSLQCNASDVAVMPSSGGTTGYPKAVELTHRNIISNVLQIYHPDLNVLKSTTAHHQDVLSSVLPFFHMYAMCGVVFGSMHSMSKVVSLAQFRPELYIKTLVEYKLNVLHVVPHIITWLSNSPDVKPVHLDSVRTIFSGAAPLGASDEEQFMRKINKPIDILQAYGSTETSPCVTLESRKKGKQGSVGEPLSNTLIKIISTKNTSNIALGPNQQGEILVKGPQVMKGYFKQPKETEEAIIDGWFRTGDIGYYDNNKLFYVTDRLKDMIKVKGYQVAPAELEAIIRDHPDVLEAAVVGILDKEFGEVPKAFIVLNQDATGKPKEIEKYVATKVASYKQIRGGVVIVDSLPKSLTGKILRRSVKTMYEKGNC